MNNYCVYTHLHNDKVFYVGMGKPERPYEYPMGRSEKWLDYYYSVNKQINVQITANGLTKNEALQKENELITYYGLKNLVNIQSGVTKVKGLSVAAIVELYKHGASQQTKVINFIVSKIKQDKNISITVAQLVELTGVSKPTVIDVLKTLESVGFIARKTGAIIVNPDFIFKGKDKDKHGIMITFNGGINHE